MAVLAAVQKKWRACRGRHDEAALGCCRARSMMGFISTIQNVSVAASDGTKYLDGPTQWRSVLTVQTAAAFFHDEPLQPRRFLPVYRSAKWIRDGSSTGKRVYSALMSSQCPPVTQTSAHNFDRAFLTQQRSRLSIETSQGAIVDRGKPALDQDLIEDFKQAHRSNVSTWACQDSRRIPRR